VLDKAREVWYIVEAVQNQRQQVTAISAV